MQLCIHDFVNCTSDVCYEIDILLAATYVVLE